MTEARNLATQCYESTALVEQWQVIGGKVHVVPTVGGNPQSALVMPQVTGLICLYLPDRVPRKVVET